MEQSKSNEPLILGFADMSLDTGLHRLRRGKKEIELPKLTYRLLLTLLRAAPNLVTYDQIIDKVWFGRSVAPETVTQRVKLLRDALGDDAENPRYFRVIIGEGVQLIPEVHESGVDYSSARPLSRRRVLIGVASVAILVAMVLLWTNNSSDDERAAMNGGKIFNPKERSIAVLPFENLSPDPDDAYFASGIHNEVLNQLTKVDNLTVISRTSVMRYGKGDKSIPEIARELNVQSVMEGSVRYAEDRVKISVQLIDAASDSTMWSEVYDRDFEHIFAIQADIAAHIATALEAELLPEDRARLEINPTVSKAAYALYLRAVSLGTSLERVESASDYLDTAIRLDPNFARAYERKAFIYGGVLGGNIPAHQAEYERITKENAEQALALDNTLALAHVALAYIHTAHWRWEEAEQEVQEALRLSPNEYHIFVLYSRVGIYSGNYNKAVEYAQKAVDLDPQGAGGLYFLGISQLYARNHDAAAETFRRCIEHYSAFGNYHLRLGITEGIRGNREIALSELQIAEQLWGESIQTPRFPQLANGYAQIGQRDDVDRLFAGLQNRAVNSPVNAAHWALMYIALEDFDQALKWLEVAVKDEAPDLISLAEIKANPYAIAALDEPRFKTLRGQIGQ
jgi:TolB-like protein/DNA-binding winged helix-turn-helix (wHTH) protein/Tfp pilus assembly protein PilF